MERRDRRDSEESPDRPAQQDCSGPLALEATAVSVAALDPQGRLDSLEALALLATKETRAWKETRAPPDRRERLERLVIKEVLEMTVLVARMALVVPQGRPALLGVQE